ncbi:pimeloyl-ACP methyl esterase BioG family protein [Ruegeria sp. HKCCA6837]|uniref:pimeloyl-ACP methyl esterase BioG family protein n=1 Tax=Ruegeria sp. HKCCA6837 TaxID=2682989 RepID=UPI001487F0B6|nr:pimeloyl-ACP methyl esterase BioG family protein [Ruegeria sp. HKCCA6837]
MKHRWLEKSGDGILILVFGGWALGAAPFQGLSGGASVLLVDDYTQLDDPLPDLTGFDRVDMLAFSFGVASAAHWLANTQFRPDRLVAVSGTLHPTCPDRGIAPEMIRATADQLTTSSFSKFCRRAGLSVEAPELDLAAAQQELHAVIRRGSALNPGFDLVWIPDRDRIIPTKAQEAAWAETSASVKRVAGSHVPFGSGQNWAEWLS